MDLETETELVKTCLVFSKLTQNLRRTCKDLRRTFAVREQFGSSSGAVRGSSSSPQETSKFLKVWRKSPREFREVPQLLERFQRVPAHTCKSFISCCNHITVEVWMGLIRLHGPTHTVPELAGEQHGCHAGRQSPGRPCSAIAFVFTGAATRAF